MNSSGSELGFRPNHTLGSNSVYTAWPRRGARVPVRVSAAASRVSHSTGRFSVIGSTQIPTRGEPKIKPHKSSRLGWIATLFLAGAVFAQQERGSISGMVLDATGAVVPSAKLVITNRDTNTTFTTVSGDAGQYTIP